MSITISDEAVTAAAKALHHAEWIDEAAAEQCWTQDPHGHADYGVQARIAIAAALPSLLAELRRTEGDLAVAARVATERGQRVDELLREITRAEEAAGEIALQCEALEAQRQAVLDLCDQMENPNAVSFDLVPMVNVKLLRRALADWPCAGASVTTPEDQTDDAR